MLLGMLSLGGGLYFLGSFLPCVAVLQVIVGSSSVCRRNNSIIVIILMLCRHYKHFFQSLVLAFNDVCLAWSSLLVTATWDICVVWLMLLSVKALTALTLPPVLWHCSQYESSEWVGHQEEHAACKENFEWWGAGMSGAKCKWFAHGPADDTATLSSLASLNPEWFYFSGASLPRLYWKRGR